MLHKVASCLTEYSITHRWIDPSKAQWCRYALEKRLGMGFFSLLCLLTAAVTDTWGKLCIFVLVFYLFRRRLGGWHAKAFWSCQLISLGTMIAAVVIIGPFLEHANLYALIVINLVLLGCTYLLTPAYPPSAHFSQEVRIANTKRKNQLLLGLSILQFLCLKLWWAFLVYSFLGLVIADLSVLLQINIQRKEGRISHENYRKNHV